MEDTLVTHVTEYGFGGLAAVLLVMFWRLIQKVLAVIENNTEIVAEFKASNLQHETRAKDTAREQREILTRIDQRTARCPRVAKEET